MRRRNAVNEVVRASITEALERLMRKKAFGEITVTEIAKLAGVGRVSFYRNFRSKEDVLVRKLDEAGEAWWEEYRRRPDADCVLGLFQHASEMKDFALLMYRHDLSYLLFRNVLDCMGPSPGSSDEEVYEAACLAGGVFGVLDEWIRRGMTDSPEKMSALLSRQGACLLRKADVEPRPEPKPILPAISDTN